MPIPFIQALPGGGSKLASIACSEPIELMARTFLDGDGRYRMAIGIDGAVTIAATIKRGNEIWSIADETVPNGPEVLEAVDRIVRASVDAQGRAQ